MTESNRTSNLVASRLRAAASGVEHGSIGRMYIEGAEEIERLTEELDTHLKVHLGVVRENVGLRAALAKDGPTTCLGIIKYGVCSCGLGTKHAGGKPESFIPPLPPAEGSIRRYTGIDSAPEGWPSEWPKRPADETSKSLPDG